MSGILGAAKFIGSNEVLIVIGIVVALFFVILMFVVGQFLSLSIQASLSGCPIWVTRLIAMRLRKVDLRAVIYSRIRLDKAGIDIGPDPVKALESHWLAGGDLTHCTSAMIALKGAGIPMTWEQLARGDSSGRDVLEAAMKMTQAKAHGGSLAWEQALKNAPPRPERQRN